VVEARKAAPVSGGDNFDGDRLPRLVHRPSFAAVPVNLTAPDLTRHPPRSPRVRLGGYVQLPRILDKARAAAAGQLGDYDFPAPLDRHFYTFTGITPDELLALVQTGASDTEVISWIQARVTRTSTEIGAWSTWLAGHAPADTEMHAWFSGEIARLAPGRDDLRTYFDLLDLDDFVSFGGRG
jgi:hypothetical protein